MITTTEIDQVSTLARPESTSVAAAETGKMVELLRSLGDDDWSKPTDCPV